MKKPRKNLKQHHRNWLNDKDRIGSPGGSPGLKDFTKSLGWKKAKDQWVKA